MGQGRKGDGVMSIKKPEKQPRAFVSYSWSSPAHEAWVELLASELAQAGVDVVLDKWDLLEGHDTHAFMEKMVSDPSVTHVLLISDAVYATKADTRAGGVGTEAQILSPSLYGKVSQTKIVAVVRERRSDGTPCLPTYYGARKYIDMSNDDDRALTFDRLLRWLHGKPLHLKPTIGVRPTYLDAPAPEPIVGDLSLQKKALDALRSGKPNALALVEDYFTACVRGVEALRIPGASQPGFDDRLIKCIGDFRPSRDAIVEVIGTLFRHDRSAEGIEKVHRLLEGLLPYCDVPSGTSSYNNLDFDNFKCITHEMFLITMALALQRERFDAASVLLGQPYFIQSSPRGGAKTMTYMRFRQPIHTLIERGQRGQRSSLWADLLKDRAVGASVDFRAMMQADFFVFLRSAADALSASGQSRLWWPETLLYAESYEGAFEIFARSESGAYFGRLKSALGVRSKADLENVHKAFSDSRLRLPTWDFHEVDVAAHLGIEKLVSRA
jgi:hypothetical protein